MSLVDGLRGDAVQTKRHELNRLSRAHSASLRELLAVYGLVSKNSSLNTLIPPNFNLDTLTDDEEVFLRNYDLANGRTFDATSALTLRSSHSTTATQQFHDAPNSLAGLGNVSLESSEKSHASRSSQATTEQAIIELQQDESTPAGLTAATVASNVPSAGQLAPSSSTSRRASAQPEDVAPLQVASLQPEEQLSGATEQTLNQQVPPRPAKVVHLPPEHVQEERLRLREVEEHQRRSESEAKASQHLAAPQTELASSPSSTVGAYSAATPQLPQDSPDTSPDSETAHAEVLPPKELQPSPEEQREKEEHDRILEAQKEIARKQALGDVATPDEQLRWEEREASARAAEEQAANADVGGPEPDAKSTTVSTEAQKVAESMDVDMEEGNGVATSTEVITDPSSASQTGALNGDDSNAITAPLSIDTTTNTQQMSPPAETTPMQAPVRPPRMTTRVSSGAMRQKSVSEILGQDRDHSQSADNTAAARKDVLSPDPASPLMTRHPLDNSNTAARTSSSLQAARPPRLLSGYRQTNQMTSAMDQLECLRGAAEDPDKDYLEPLFRIQAHESSNTRTHSLPELIKVGSKTLSTEDHFTSIHERLDYKMLRRIYQLQNANKWSLRQMEKAPEPDQPVTHHDHMMEEMRWMRKDFRAERKMKKSVCAWLAQRCSEWVVAGPTERKKLQVKVTASQTKQKTKPADELPDLEQTGDSAPEDEYMPSTPRSCSTVPTTIVVAPELGEVVEELLKTAKLSKTLESLPKTGLLDLSLRHKIKPITEVSKFVDGKVLPNADIPTRKRSRYDYEDEDEILSTLPNAKRARDDESSASNDHECALFHSENKPIRDRLHSNNAFRPPSEFLMPTIQFYEWRNGSQWIWEDDQKLRKLAKEYSFNWSLIADEMALSTRYKSSAERRTPWECFERWVELESLPADMRKTVYFKTWFSRLEQSQQAAERRYQANVQAIQAQQAANGGPAHVPIRRRTVPTRVEKRRSTRYLWMVEGFRKLAKKREQAAWKQAETARAAAQRKSQTETKPPQMMKMTPQEFSKKRYERDLQAAEHMRQQRAKLIEAQQRQIQMARQAQLQGGQPGAANGAAGQARPQPGNIPQQAQMQANGQPMPHANGQMVGQQQGRAAQLQAATRNGLLAPPPMNGQGIPQAQMQARAAQMGMQQMPQANGQMRNPQFASQQFQMANMSMSNPGANNMTTQQELQRNQALLAAFQQQQQSANSGQLHPNSNGQQMNGSPSMPPPPMPQQAGALSSGHVPQIIAIKNQIRSANPNLSEEQVSHLAAQQLQKQSQQSQQSTAQARQNAMNAAAGITSQSIQAGNNSRAFTYNQVAYQNNQQRMTNGMNGMNGKYSSMNGDGNQQQVAANMSPVGQNASPSQNSQNQQAYAQRMLQMQRMQMQSPQAGPAQLNGSPSLAHASPNMAPASPAMQYPNMPVNQMANMSGGMNGQRPPSRSNTNTPQMTRLGSSGSGVGPIVSGMQSPGSMGQPQGSPRNMQASMAR